jgi:hypothetical protein
MESDGGCCAAWSHMCGVFDEDMHVNVCFQPRKAACTWLIAVHDYGR